MSDESIIRRKTHMIAPATLTKPQQHIWRKTVKQFPPDYFLESDTPLLKSYCRYANLTDQAAFIVSNAAELTEDKLDGAKQISALFRAMDIANRTLLALAQKLRLTPFSRTYSHGVAPQAKKMETGDVPDRGSWKARLVKR